MSDHPCTTPGGTITTSPTFTVTFFTSYAIPPQVGPFGPPGEFCALLPSVDDIAVGEHRSAAGDDEIALGLEVVREASWRSARRKSCHRAPAWLGLRRRT